MHHKTITLDIKGMHCRSCEILLEENIAEIPGIQSVHTNYRTGTAKIAYTDSLNLELIDRAVHTAGYGLGKADKKHFFSRNVLDYAELAASASIFLVLYLLLTRFTNFDFSLAANETSGLFGVLIVGLTAGVSTCMALIGGLILALSSRHAELHPEASMSQKFRPHIFFNIGRIISYVLFGGLIGLLGSAFQFSSGVLGILTAILGIAMLFLGLKLIGIFPRLDGMQFTLPKSLSKVLGLHKESKEYSHRGAFVTGALTFFVPCGFTQAMQLLAVSTGSFTGGALIMGVFALGTLPGIIGIGGITSAIKGIFSNYFFKFAGLVVITLSIFNVSSGMSLAGFELNLSKNDESAVQTEAVRIENGKQIVEMTQISYGYEPNRFTVRKGIPVVWKITSTNPYTCAAYVSFPDAGISKPLSPGMNIFEFTPVRTGKMRFTCSMGMYSGFFNVIE